MKKSILILTLALGTLFSLSSCSSTNPTPGGQSMPGMSAEEHSKMKASSSMPGMNM